MPVMAIAEQQPDAVATLGWTGVLHEWTTTVDHKKIGILYVLMSLVFLVVAGLEAISCRRTRSISSSRCTARRWSSSSACQF